MKKSNLVISAALLGLALLAGCAGSQDKAAETETSAASAEVTETETTSEAEETEAENAEEAEAAADESEPEAKASAAPDYSLSDNWAYYAEGEKESSADVFFICPTVYSGDEGVFNMSLEDEEAKASFLGATNMEKGIYDADARFFAPYYRQGGLNIYELSAEEREPYLQFAYDDIALAFDYYMEYENNGRPIILAGFSQGADLCIRLLKDNFEDESLQSKLIACYAIGWSITEEEIEAYPWLHFAEGEDDIGVIIAFNSEAESITDSMMIPEGTKTLCINPLNWKTDSTPADKSLNMGACFTDYDGNITSEIPELTGAYIDEVRGALKVTDVTPEEYPAGLYIFEDGIYHLYDYQFFYRNLQENVEVRTEAYLGAAELEEAA